MGKSRLVSYMVIGGEEPDAGQRIKSLYAECGEQDTVGGAAVFRLHDDV
jgi:hypothetical protein